MEKKKKFRKFKIPRYLPGSVAEVVWKADLREYNKHRYKMFTIQKLVDDNPPKMNPYNYLKKSSLGRDRDRLIQIEKENRQLLIKINTINRTKGKIDSYNPDAYKDRTNWQVHEFEMKRIEKDNRKIFKRLIGAQSSYQTEEMKIFWGDIVKKMAYTAKYPLFFMQKKPTLDDYLKAEPSISGDLEQTAERFYCVLQFKIRDGPCLGKILIELYHDHAPVTVQNFLSICNEEGNLTYKNCLIHNIVRGKYIETGDITKGNGKGGCSVYGETFDEENFTLKHTRAGVLSMIPVKKRQNSSLFSITLSKMEKLDGKRVVFGKVIRGNSVLFKIEDLGRKVGKPGIPIIISDCYEYREDRKKTKL